MCGDAQAMGWSDTQKNDEMCAEAARKGYATFCCATLSRDYHCV